MLDMLMGEVRKHESFISREKIIVNTSIFISIITMRIQSEINPMTSVSEVKFNQM